MSRLPILLALAAAFAGEAAAQELPPPVAAARDEFFTDCRSFGGRPRAMPGLVTTHDLNGDGTPDYILSAMEGINCEGAVSALCAGQACPLRVFLSGPGGFRSAYAANVHGWEIDRAASPPVLTLMWLASHCGLNYRGPDTCERRYAASGQAMVEIGGQSQSQSQSQGQGQGQSRSQGQGQAQAGSQAARPAPGPGGKPPPQGQPAAPGGAAAGAWQLRPLQNRGHAAMAQGPGVVAAMALFCNGPVPMAAFTLRARPPAGRTVVSFAFPSGRIDAPIAQPEGEARGSARNVWYADLRASRLPRMLAGNDSSVPLLINGGQQGRLSLAGSTAAIRSALAPCYPF